MPGILVAIAVFLIVGTVNMILPPSVQVPGPTFFPIIVIGLLLLMAVLSTVQILRTAAAPRRHAGPEAQDSTTSTPTPISGADSDLDGDQVEEIPPDPPPGREPWPARAFRTGGRC